MSASIRNESRTAESGTSPHLYENFLMSATCDSVEEKGHATNISMENQAYMARNMGFIAARCPVDKRQMKDVRTSF